MRKILLAVWLLGCVEEQTTPPVVTKRSDEAELADRMRTHDATAVRAARSHDAGAVAPTPTPVADRMAKQHLDECHDGQAQRRAEREQRLASEATRAKAEAWVAEHCTRVDKSHMVVKTFQDSNGVVYQREVPSEGVTTKCDAKSEWVRVNSDGSQSIALPAVVNPWNPKWFDCRDVDEPEGLVPADGWPGR